MSIRIGNTIVSGGNVPLIDALNSTRTDAALTAKQGKVLDEKKIDLPSGGSIGDVLKKTASGVEWGQGGGGSANAVQYTQQSLTDLQQNQARKNQGLYYEEEQSTNYFKWDGNTTGLESVSVPSQIPSFEPYYYRVSSQTPSYADLTGASIAVQSPIEQEYVPLPAVQQGNCVLLVDQAEGYSTAYVISVLVDNSQVVIGGNTLTFAHAGLYFMGFSPSDNQCTAWICKLTTAGNVLRYLVPTVVPKRFLPNDLNIATCSFVSTGNQTYTCSMSIADIFNYTRKMILVVGFFIDATIRPVILSKASESTAELVTMGTTLSHKFIGETTGGVDTWTYV